MTDKTSPPWTLVGVGAMLLGLAVLGYGLLTDSTYCLLTSLLVIASGTAVALHGSVLPPPEARRTSTWSVRELVGAAAARRDRD